ncbi:MAG: hypothetical protein ACRDWG_20845 [Actinomycetes bacterium]
MVVVLAVGVGAGLGVGAGAVVGGRNVPVGSDPDLVDGVDCDELGASSVGGTTPSTGGWAGAPVPGLASSTVNATLATPPTNAVHRVILDNRRSPSARITAGGPG